MKNQIKTKIVCTIGPASESVDVLRQLANAGMNIARLNFSHGDYQEHGKRIKNIRNVSRKTNKSIAIMLDTKGPEIRTGLFEEGGVYFSKEDIVRIVRFDVLGTKEQFTLQCKEVFDDIKVGNLILFDDGKMRFEVISKEEDGFTCKVLTHGWIKNRKGVNIPDVHLPIPFLSQKDIDDITFGVSEDLDILSLSFVRSKEDIDEVRGLLKKLGAPHMTIMSKIESKEAIQNLEEIIQASDAIMVARGDLAVETEPEDVPLYQKRIIKRCNQLGKPVVTATHMLDSMCSNPTPTRAEASDVANAILDGTDAVMLSGESAAGEYPVESVEMLVKIAASIEPFIPYRERLNKAIEQRQRTINDAICISVVECTLNLDYVSAIIAFTETGSTAKRISMYRPNVPIIACTEKEEICIQLAHYWGVFPTIVENIRNIAGYDGVANEIARRKGLPIGSKVIITSGMGGTIGGTNTIRVIEVSY